MKTIEERFWDKVEKTESGCWEWQACRMPNGYGRFAAGPGQGPMLAHRFVMIHLEGMDLTPKQLVCHRCDNRRCVNPAHLFIGSAKENTHDMIRKGRQSIGVRPGSKLDPARVRLIRERIAAGIAQTAIALEFGVSQGTVTHIHTGKSWRHVA